MRISKPLLLLSPWVSKQPERRWCDIFSATVCLFSSSDDVDHRSSHTNIAQASSVPFAPPQMPVSASMPWLGSGQTSMGASVVRASVLHTHTHTTQTGPRQRCSLSLSLSLPVSAASSRVQRRRLQPDFSCISTSAAEPLQAAGPSVQLPLCLFNSYQYPAELMPTKQLAC